LRRGGGAVTLKRRMADRIEPDCIEIEDRDILGSEPSGDDRPTLRVEYDSLLAFLGHYFALKRGEAMLIPAPLDLAAGELVDVDIRIPGAGRVRLHAELSERWPDRRSVLATAHFIVGAFTDRIIGRLLDRAARRRPDLPGRLIRAA